MGGVVKEVGKVVDKVVDITFDVVVTIPGKVVSEGLEAAGGVVAKVPGLDSLGREIERWGEDLGQVIDVLDGKYQDDVEKVKKYQNQLDKNGKFLEARIAKYNMTVDELIGRIDNLVAFEEIFTIAIGN